MHDQTCLSRRGLKASRRDGFTIVEVAIASFILIFAIASSLTALQIGFQAVESAKNVSLADQILQSEIEDLRLKSWNLLKGAYDVTNEDGVKYTLTNSVLSDEIRAKGFTLELMVYKFKDHDDMVKLLVTTTWTNQTTGRKYSRTYQTLYCRGGLTDYFVATHSS